MSWPADRLLRGAFTALVTPFTADGAVDERAFRDFVDWQLMAGIDGLVPCGTTGESPTLSSAEKDALIDWAVEAARAHESERRVAVIAGTGTNDTAASIAATRRAAALGADAALVVTPYYNRPDQRMIVWIWSRLPLASLTATMRGCSARRSSVAASTLAPVRPGTL